jgi:hypothetical protein
MGGNVLVESNSVLEFLRPDLYLSVLDPGTADFKESAKLYLDRADALLLTTQQAGNSAWTGVALKLLEERPCFQMRPPEYVTPEIASFVRERLERLGT